MTKRFWCWKATAVHARLDEPEFLGRDKGRHMDCLLSYPRSLWDSHTTVREVRAVSPIEETTLILVSFEGSQGV